MVATIRYINVNPDGGVPKRHVTTANIEKLGLKEDKQNSHGGLNRAVLLYDNQKIIKLQADGHPIAPGTAGENITIDFWREGLSYDNFKKGDIIKVGKTILELTFTAPPCEGISKSFLNGDWDIVNEKINPTYGRWCAKVLKEGQISIGDVIEKDNL